jgi:hypothetical protein
MMWLMLVCKVGIVKVAVIGFDAALNVMLQVVVPVHPVQLVKTEFDAGASLSVTTVPAGNIAVQVAPTAVEQLIPAGLLVTVPVPVPARVTVTVSFVAKVAVIGFDDVLNVILQEVVPVHPVQLVKTEPVAGVSVRVTAVPGAKLALQVAPVAVEQLIPAGVLVTVPVPDPARVTETVSLPLEGVKVSVTFAAAFIVTLHVPVPVHAPPHPPKV